VSFTTKQIADAIGGIVQGDKTLTIKGINSLEAAEPGEISIYYDIRYKKALQSTNASAIIVSKPEPSFRGTQILVKNPANMLCYLN